MINSYVTVYPITHNEKQLESKPAVNANSVMSIDFQLSEVEDRKYNSFLSAVILHDLRECIKDYDFGTNITSSIRNLLSTAADDVRLPLDCSLDAASMCVCLPVFFGHLNATNDVISFLSTTLQQLRSATSPSIATEAKKIIYNW